MLALKAITRYDKYTFNKTAAEPCTLLNITILLNTGHHGIALIYILW